MPVVEDADFARAGGNRKNFARGFSVFGVFSLLFPFRRLSNRRLRRQAVGFRRREGRRIEGRKCR